MMTGCWRRAAIAVAFCVVLAGQGTAVAANPYSVIYYDHSNTACVDKAGTNHLSAFSETGLAYNGSSLMFSCWGDDTITFVNPHTHAQVGVYHVSDGSSGTPLAGMGALAWDAPDNELWVCNLSAFNGTKKSQATDVGYVTLNSGTMTGTFTHVFNAKGGCDNGVAYDPYSAPASIWTASVANSTTKPIYIYSTSGAALGQQAIGSLTGGNAGGMAFTTDHIYVANPQTSTKHVYELSPTFTSPKSILQGSHRFEDMECDDTTFAPQTVVWVEWYNQNAAKPLPVSGSCNQSAPQKTLSVSQTDDGPVTVGSQLTFHITVANTLSTAQTGVSLSDNAPSGASVNSLTASQGSCSASSGTCNLGTLAGSGSATVTLVVTPSQPGTATNTATATSDQSSAATSSDSATVNAGANVVYVTVNDSGFTPSKPGSPEGGIVQWNLAGTTSHSATDDTGMGLFDSGAKSPGASFQYTYNAAGLYTVIDTPTGHTGQVSVLLVVPATGSTGTPFTVTWAAAAPPSGFAEDIQVEKPGTTKWVTWLNGQTGASAAYTAASTGTWKFRARYHDTQNGKASKFSTAKSIKIS